MKIKYLLLVLLLTSFSQAENLILNGDFEEDPTGTTTGDELGNFDDIATITGWRIFNANNPDRDFSAWAGDGSTPPTPFRPYEGETSLIVYPSGNATVGGDYGVDTSPQRIPVSFGTDYEMEFAGIKWADVPGGLGFLVVIAEFEGRAFIGNAVAQFVPLTDRVWTVTAVGYTPSAENVDNIVIGFRPRDTINKVQYSANAGMGLDAVSLSVGHFD